MSSYKKQLEEYPLLKGSMFMMAAGCMNSNTVLLVVDEVEFGLIHSPSSTISPCDPPCDIPPRSPTFRLTIFNGTRSKRKRVVVVVVDDGGGVSGVELESSPCVGFSSMLYVCSPVLPHLFLVP